MGQKVGNRKKWAGSIEHKVNVDSKKKTKIERESKEQAFKGRK